MKSTWLLIAACLAGIFLHLRSDTDRRQLPPPAPAVIAKLEQPRPLWQPHWSNFPIQPSAQIPEKKTSPQAPPRRKPTIVSRPLPPLTSQNSEPFLSQTELEISAALTQNRAATELKRLDRLLKLTESQADEIFPILARRADSYHPDLKIRIGRSETSNPSPLPSEGRRTKRKSPAPETEIEDELEEILTPPQNQTLTAEQIESDQWWSEILSELAASQ